MRLVFTVGLVAFLMRLSTPQIALQDEAAGVSGWDQEGAAKYLDDRMDAWFASAEKLETGTSETTCVSCHTAVPYALARPALREAMGVSTVTPQELRLIDEVRRRVETYGSHEVVYDLDEVKKKEAQGTEAVLNVLVLANADAWQERRHPSASTEKALEQLWETQGPDGAWDWFEFGLEPFETVDSKYYGAALAAFAIGTAPGVSTSETGDARVGIERLDGYLNEMYSQQNLFNRVHALLASTRLKDLLTPEQRERLIAELRSRQRSDGGWSLDTLGPWRWSKSTPPFKAPGTPNASLVSESDGYATGLIVYTLRETGVPTNDPAVKKGLQWLRANQRVLQIDQQAWTAWRAYSLNFDREHGGEKGEPWRRMFMSDAATAFAVLALVDGRERPVGHSGG